MHLKCSLRKASFFLFEAAKRMRPRWPVVMSTYHGSHKPHKNIPFALGEEFYAPGLPVISPVSGWIVMVFGLNPWEQDGDDTGDRRTRTFASHITPQNLPQSTHTTSKYLFRYDEHACHSIIQPAHSIITDHGARRPVVAITIIRSIEGSPMSHRWPIGAVAVESRYL